MGGVEAGEALDLACEPGFLVARFQQLGEGRRGWREGVKRVRSEFIASMVSVGLRSTMRGGLMHQPAAAAAAAALGYGHNLIPAQKEAPIAIAPS